eukprot:8049061-Pyramimonas_sp.AAC.1
MADRQTCDEAKAKPAAQPAGGSASGLTPVAHAQLSLGRPGSADAGQQRESAKPPPPSASPSMSRPPKPPPARLTRPPVPPPLGLLR